MSRIDEIRSSIEGSTVTDCMLVAAEWVTFKRAQEARAAAGRVTALKHGQAVRDKIISAAGALPAQLLPEHDGWPSAVLRRIRKDPPRYGFDVEPDPRTVRKAHRYLLTNGTTLPSCTPLPACALYSSSSTT